LLGQEDVREAITSPHGVKYVYVVDGFIQTPLKTSIKARTI
jgi:hypothetical protein